MLDPNPERRVKADFFIELYPVIHDREVVKFKWFSAAKFTDQMLQKYGTDKPVRSVTDFRLVKQYITNAKRHQKLPEIDARLRKFSEEVDLPLTALRIDEVDVAAEARKITANISELSVKIKALDADKFFGEEQLWDELNKLRLLIQIKLKEADRRFE